MDRDLKQYGVEFRVHTLDKTASFIPSEFDYIQWPPETGNLFTSPYHGSLNQAEIEKAKTEITQIPHANNEVYSEDKTLIEQGSDRRKQVMTKKSKIFPYSAMVQILFTFESRGEIFNGSGTLVGPRHVLTTRSNVVLEDDDGEEEFIQSGVVVPARNLDDAPFGKTNVIKAFIFDDQSIKDDIALLILEDPIGELTGWLGTMMLAKESTLKKQEVRVTGYPHEKEYTKMFTHKSKVLDASADVLVYDIDATKGQGGGPIWIKDLVNAYVLGVHYACNIRGSRGIRLTEGKFYYLNKWISETLGMQGDKKAIVLKNLNDQNSNSVVRNGNVMGEHASMARTNEGAIYEGDTQDGEPHGRGTMKWPDGRKYIGEFRNGKFEGQGTLIFSNKDKYTGEWEQNLPSGKGVMEFTDGRRYEGDWAEGHQQGKGTFSWPDGDVYSGQWAMDQRHGTGTLEYGDGDKYEGDWCEDLRHGIGTYTASDGSKYEGQWQNDMKDGKGKCLWSNGDTYEGMLKEDKFHGKGVFTVKDGTKYDGQWRDGLRHGYGLLFLPDGSQYQGDWINDKKEGKGIFLSKDGKKYDGQFKDGVRNGFGTFVSPIGDKYEGNWQNDQCNGIGTYTYSDGKKYKGKWLNNQKHGLGQNGDYYEGEWKDNKRCGKGTLKYSNGKIYVGEWHDGQRHGKGIYYYPDGSRFEGTWDNNKKNGEGVFIDAENRITKQLWGAGILINQGKPQSQ